MNKRFRVCGLYQPFLLPPSLQDWLPEDHLARFIADVTNELDLSAIYAQYERQDGRGLSAYHPLLLTRLPACSYKRCGCAKKRDWASSAPAWVGPQKGSEMSYANAGVSAGTKWRAA